MSSSFGICVTPRKWLGPCLAAALCWSCRSNPFEDRLPLDVLRVSVRTTGDSLDPDGYSFWVDDSTVGTPLGLNDSRLVTDLPYGEHWLHLRGVAQQCLVQPHSDVEFFLGYDGATNVLDFQLSCTFTVTRLQDRIVFLTDRDRYHQVYAIRPDGTGLVRVTNVSADVGAPAVSPDGTGIAFRTLVACFIGCSYRLDIANVDQGGSREVPDFLSSGARAAWSPDNTRLAVVGVIGGFAIFVIPLDGGDPRRLTDSAAFVSVRNPAWSPDGTRIGFLGTVEDTATRAWHSRGYLVHPDGTGLAPIPTPDTLELDEIAWSPDWSRIAFVAWNPGPPTYHYLFVINPDGTGLTRLTDEHIVPYDLSWSPDGGHIAFSGVFVTDVAGTSLTSVAAGCCQLGSPTWSPDGTRMAWHGTPDGRWRVYVANVDGSDARNLTGEAFEAWWPTWVP